MAESLHLILIFIIYGVDPVSSLDVPLAYVLTTFQKSGYMQVAEYIAGDSTCR